MGAGPASGYPAPMLRRALFWLDRCVRPAAFSVAFGPGRVRPARGRVPAGFLHDCAAIAAEFGIARGRVDALHTWRGPALRFSPDVPASSHQRFRNVFALLPRGWR